MLKRLTLAFQPNSMVSRSAIMLIGGMWIICLLCIWSINPFALIPKPLEVVSVFGPLIKRGLAYELWSSFSTNVEALFLTTVISLGLAYLTVVPAFRPLVGIISKGRFLGMVGFTLVFTLLTPNAHILKVSILTFSMTLFFVTAMAEEVSKIPREKFDHARTLRMNEWQVVWEVVILGGIDRAIEVMRQNAAMGWMMLTMVEGLVRSEGGIGTMLLDQNKYFHLSAVFALQVVILIVGLCQDAAIGLLRRLLCPYAFLSLERRGS